MGGQLFDYKIIAVDDGSADDTPRILDEYAETNERLVVVHKENGGPAAARKLGIERSESDYIAFCDADDYVEPDWLQCMYTYLKRYNADFSMVGAFINDSEEKMVQHEPYMVTTWNRDEAYEKFIEHKMLNGVLWTNLFKRSLFENLEWNLNMRVYEDDYLVWQILHRINTIVKVHTAKYHYMFSPTSLTNRSYNINRHQSTYVLLNRIISDCRKPELKCHLDSAMRMQYQWTLSDFYNVVIFGIKTDDIDYLRNILRKGLFKYFGAIKGLKNKGILLTLVINPSLTRWLYGLIKPSYKSI